ncbi:YncE family protein [Methanosarcina sp.]|uniref:YncE family protein n=1 Tax=Methanosarcina sp. TaxID=2213 RepID=UPI002AB994E9|nr:YncE family protein [Methanosarcina sp.]MDY9925130.1 YncE family protein [Methanosarcina sp.]
MKKRGKAYPIVLASTAFLLLLIIFSSTESTPTVQSNLSAAYAYVPNEKSNDVSVINITTDTFITNISVGANPAGVAVSPDGKKVYVTNEESNNISIIDTSNYSNITSVSVQMYPLGVAITPDGKKVYVANYYSKSVSVIDASNYSVNNVSVGAHPIEVAITPDGTKAFVANHENPGGSVSVINAITNTVTDTVENVGNYPCGVAVTPDGKKVYVTNSGSNNICVIDTKTNEVINSNIDVKGYGPAGLGQFIGPLPEPPQNSSTWRLLYKYISLTWYFINNLIIPYIREIISGLIVSVLIAVIMKRYSKTFK